MIRFDPHTGKFVLQAHAKVNYQYEHEGALVDEWAEGIGEVFLTPLQVGELATLKQRAVSTWHHEDGRGVTIGNMGEDWKVVWHGTGPARAVANELMVKGSDYREYISRLRYQGFKPMALPVPPPPAPTNRVPPRPRPW